MVYFFHFDKFTGRVSTPCEIIDCHRPRTMDFEALGGMKKSTGG